MNEIILPMKVHAVKLEYRRLKLEKMPHGYFRTIKGKKFVLITYDPEYPKYNKSHPRYLITTTKLGKKYTELINEYLYLKSEYDELLISWNSRYRIAPPKVKFPIVQFYDPHMMDNKYYDRQEENTGKYKPDNPTISEHGELKSKNEQIGADLLKRMGIPFKYETSLYIDSLGETINPDYLLNFREIDRCSYLEILGMNDKGNYSVSTATKINGFSKDRYRSGREVIYIILYDKYNFDEEHFITTVLGAFNDMIPDSSIIWDSDNRQMSQPA